MSAYAPRLEPGHGRDCWQPGSKDHSSQLLVEGPDDQQVVRNLTRIMGIGWSSDSHRIPDPNFPHLEICRGGPSVLARLSGELKQERLTRVGILLDADGRCSDRWREVREALQQDGPPSPMLPRLPEAIPREGCLVPYREHRRFGVWIMPDNQAAGMLEDFLKPCVDTGRDRLWEHACSSTRRAVDLGARFGEDLRSKAELRAWLAWQKKPGRTLGIAVEEGYFDVAKDPVVKAFLDWFRRLFLDPDSPPSTSA